MNRETKLLSLLALLLLALSFTACREAPSVETATTPLQPETATAESNAPATPTLAPTVAPTPIPSPTPQLAALVNGQPILLETYEQELARYEQARAELGLPEATPDEMADEVLEALIERELVRQAAVVEDIDVPEIAVDQKLAELRSTGSGDLTFEAWLEANQWTEEQFREALAAEMLVQTMVAEVTAGVPEVAEQVRARYIQLDDPALALSILEQVRAGADFATLARQYSRDQVTAQNGGDLGFFARGSLLVPEVEEAAFALEPEETSNVVEVTDPESGQTTYYLVQLIEREAERPLTADLRYQLLQEAFESWLAEQRENATITRFLE